MVNHMHSSTANNQLASKKAVVAFLECVLFTFKKADSLSIRCFNYMSGLTDALGLGTHYFHQLLFRCEHDCERIYEQMLHHDSFNCDLFWYLLATWQGQTTKTTQTYVDEPLKPEDLQHWSEHGYVVVKNVISRYQATEVADWLLSLKGMQRNNRDSWYLEGPQSIMFERYQGALLELARNSAKAKAAFQQLWGCHDLITSVDRTSINPPEFGDYYFSGPYLHLDVNFAHPLHFRTQGIVYLNDVAENQGALTLCPGFHKRYPEWLASLKEDENPAGWNFNQLPTKAIAANAGDLIIWHHWLPHGSSPNHNSFPRIAQYLNMYSVEPQMIDISGE